MIKMNCDRCNKEIEGTTYYTISIHADDINPKTEYTVCTDTAVQNLNTNMMALFNSRPQYCKKCRDEIVAFIKDGIKT